MQKTNYRYYYKMTVSSYKFILGFIASLGDLNKPIVDIMDPTSAIATSAQPNPQDQRQE